MAKAAKVVPRKRLPPISAPSAARQVAFYQLLVAARKQWFIDALRDVLSRLDQAVIKAQAGEYIPQEAQKILATAGIRDEHVFPLPAILEERPSLVGYYRLLFGAGKAKSFYRQGTGMGMFKSMEERGTLNEAQKKRLPDFCRAMASSLAELVKQIPNITDRDIKELPLLTFGSQLQGANNTQIGKKAVEGVFLAISEIVKRHLRKQEVRKLTVLNASGRTVTISLGSDPDVSVDEVVDNRVHRRVAVEIKGGTDVSNVHNRAGEAEKSHTKAKRKGYRDFWTLISKTGVDIAKLEAESQTTTLWFNVAQVLARKGADWEEFRGRIAGEVGIPLK